MEAETTCAVSLLARSTFSCFFLVGLFAGGAAVAKLVAAPVAWGAGRGRRGVSVAESAGRRCTAEWRQDRHQHVFAN